MWTNTKSFSAVFGTDAVDGSVLSLGWLDGLAFPVDGASEGVVDGAAVVAAGAGVAAVVAAVVAAGAGVVGTDDSSANAAPPEVAIANPTIVADASV